MTRYVSLLTFTGQGVKNLKNTTKRAKAFAELAEEGGKVKILDTMWTIGPYDIVLLFEAPDNAAAASVAVSLNLLGTVRTLTMRAFDKDEMEAIVEDVISPQELLLRAEQQFD